MRDGFPIKDYSIKGLEQLLEKNFVLKNEVIGKMLKAHDHDPRIQFRTLYFTDEDIVSFLAKEAADGIYSDTCINEETNEVFEQTDEEKKNNPMRVKELIAKLAEYDPESYVLLQDIDDEAYHGKFSFDYHKSKAQNDIGEVYLCFNFPKEEE